MYGLIQGILYSFVIKTDFMKTAFCFDLDGTLTREEILPQIAKNVGLYEEINILTNITMQGLITFDKSFKLRVKLLSTIPVKEVKSTIDKISIDQHLKKFISENKDCCFIVTGNLDIWVDDFIKKNYNCNYFASKGLVDENKLLGIENILDKADAVKNIREKFNRVISIGDGMNDCSMFELSDKSIAYGGVHQPVQTLIKMSDYICYNSYALVTLLNSLKTSENEN